MTQSQPHPLDLRALRTEGNAFELDKILRKLVKAEQVTEVVINLLLDRIEEGYKPQDFLLTDLFISTQNPAILQLLKSDLKRLHWECLCKLYEARLQEPLIEKLLTEALYKAALNPAEPSRRYIAKAMKAVGSVGVLETLEAIEAELKDRAVAGAAFGDKLPLVDGLMVRSDVTFHKLVVEAIQAVRERGNPGFTTSPEIEQLEVGHDEVVSRAISSGESLFVEFKETFSLNVRTGEKDKAIEGSSLKTIAGFLNSKGGTLLIGVNDAGEPVCITPEVTKFHKGSTDTFILHFKNLIKSKIGEGFYHYIEYHIVSFQGVSVLLCNCSPAHQPCFMKDTNEFYVRVNPATDKLEGAHMMDYIHSRFP